MATFSFEEGMLTDSLLTICALRTRVSISATGSLMLISVLLPAGFSHTRDLAAQGHLAQFMTSNTELLVDTTRTTGHGATIAHTGRIRIARQLLQLETGEVTLFVGFGLIVNDCPELCTLFCVLFD